MEMMKQEKSMSCKDYYLYINNNWEQMCGQGKNLNKNQLV